jgi:hypothetical protein
MPTSSNASSNFSEGSMPNIAANIEFKSTQMIGSIKAVNLILLSISTSSSLNMLVNENDDYNFYKFKVEIRNFLMEMLDYLRIQQTDMNSFLNVQMKNDHNKDDAKEENSDEEKTAKKVKLDDETEQPKPSTATVTASPATSSRSSPDSNLNTASTSKNPLKMQVMRQVEYKKRHLDHVIQALVQTINFLTTSLSDSPFASTSTNSDSSSSSSSSQSSTESDSSSENASKETSVSSSPSHESNIKKT